LWKFGIVSWSFSAGNSARSCWNVPKPTATASGRRYILQKINHHTFCDVAGLMENITSVTEFLRTKTDDPRSVLTLVKTRVDMPAAIRLAGDRLRVQAEAAQNFKQRFAHLIAPFSSFLHLILPRCGRQQVFLICCRI